MGVSNKNGNPFWPIKETPSIKLKRGGKKVGKYDYIHNFYNLEYNEGLDQIIAKLIPIEEYPEYMKKMVKLITGGGNASLHGKSQQDMIASFLDGFILTHPEISYKRFFCNYKSKREKIFCKNPYGAVINPDFVVYGIPKYPHGLVISSKYQSVSGTGDEKLEHLYKDVTEYFPKNVRVLVVIEYVAENGSPPGVQRKLTIAENEFRDDVSKYKQNGGEMFVDIIKLSQLIRFFTEVMK